MHEDRFNRPNQAGRSCAGCPVPSTWRSPTRCVRLFSVSRVQGSRYSLRDMRYSLCVIRYVRVRVPHAQAFPLCIYAFDQYAVDKYAVDKYSSLSASNGSPYEYIHPVLSARVHSRYIHCALLAVLFSDLVQLLLVASLTKDTNIQGMRGRTCP